MEGLPAGWRGPVLGWGLLLLLALPALAQAPEQAAPPADGSALALTDSDFWLTRDGSGGFHLYIRKKQGIESVLVAGDRLNEGAGGSALFTREPNRVNGAEQALFPPVRPGEEVYYLIDSTTEHYPSLGGAAFHIFLPRQALVYSSATVRVPVPVNLGEGVTLLVRAFDRAGGDPAASWADSPYTMRVNIRPWASGPVDMAHPLRLEATGTFSAFNPGPDGWQSKDFQLYPAYAPGGSLALTHHLSSYMGYTARLERDTVLVNRLVLRGMWDWELLGLEIGGFLGMNVPDTVFVNPGLSVLFKLKVPMGIFECSFQIDSSLGRELSGAGDFLQDLYDLHLVAVLPWVMLDANLKSRSMTILPEGDTSVISDHWTRYGLSIILTGDNWPVRFGISGGYQVIAWRYGHTGKYGYDGLFLGLSASWRVMPTLSVFAEGDAPVYPFDYIGDPRAATIYNVKAGVRWDL